MIRVCIFFTYVYRLLLEECHQSFVLQFSFLISDYGQPEDIGYGYQKSALSSELANFKEHYPYLTNQELEKLMLDYLEKGRPKENYYVYGKTKKSVFRERDESEYPEKLQKLSPEREDDEEEDLMYKNQSPFRERFRDVDPRGNDRHINNADLEYLSALNTLWEQYQHKQDFSDEENEDSNDVVPNDAQLSEEDIAAILSYFEDQNDDQEVYDQIGDYPVVLLKNKNSKHHSKIPQKRVWRDGAYDAYPGYGHSERLMIKKRALKTIPDLRKKKPPPSTDHTKSRDTNRNAADQELTQIFDGKKKNSSSGASSGSGSSDTHKPTSETKVASTASTVAQPSVPAETEKPIVVKKKSLDWSQYFGIDRKKRSHKRLSGDNWPEYYPSENYVEPKDMDTKFRDMEDVILDQVIKYTGAHEGVKNPEQLHRIKQKILAQLATAYNLERMRNTLKEYNSATRNVGGSSKFLLNEFIGRSLDHSAVGYFHT